MKPLHVLCCLVLPLAMPAPQGDPIVMSACRLVADFRRFLETVTSKANGDLSELYSVPDDEETIAKDSDGWVSLQRGSMVNLHCISRDGNSTVQVDGGKATAAANIMFKNVEYTYDFAIIDSNTLPNASGCVYGSLVDLWGELVIEADIRSNSSVKASLQSFTLHGPGILEVDEASITNLYGRFSGDVSIAIGNLMHKEILPIIELRIGKLINSTLTENTFNLSVSLSIPIGNEKTNGSACFNCLKSSNITDYLKPSKNNVAITKLSLKRKLKSVSKPEKNLPSVYLPLPKSNSNRVFRDNFASEGTTDFDFVPRTVSNSGKQHLSVRDVSCALKRIATVSEKKVNMKRIVFPNYSKFEATKDSTKINSSRRKYLSLENLISQEFNNVFDILLNRTNAEIVSGNLEPYRIPNEEEELYQTSDGSLKLESGNIYGMASMTLRSDPTVKKHATTATVSVGVAFKNISYTFNFSADSKTFSNISGTLHGNVTQFSGELSIVANLTNTEAVTAELKSFHLQANVEDFSTAVHFAKNVSGYLISEVADAVAAGFQDNITEWLQDKAAGVLRAAVASVHANMSSTLGSPNETCTKGSSTATPPSNSQSPSFNGSLTTHKPSSSSCLEHTEFWALIFIANVTRVILSIFC